MIIDNTAILHFSYGISIGRYEDKNFTCPQVWFEALDRVAVEAAEVAAAGLSKPLRNTEEGRSSQLFYILAQKV